MLTVWGRRSSINVQKVMWLVGELGLARKHINVERWYDALKERPAYRAHVMLPFGELAGRMTS